MGAAMGWTVHDVKAASMWEFYSAWHGFVEANSPKEAAKLTEAEADDLFDWIESGSGPAVLSTQTYWLDGERLVPNGIVSFEAS